MSANYALIVEVAGISIRFQSEMEEDICHLSTLFKHHLAADDATQADHVVDITTIERSPVPDDAVLAWKGYYHGVGYDGKHENTLKKYVSQDKRYEYFDTPDGGCVTIDRESPHTVCSLMSWKKLFSQKRERANIGSLVILLIHIIMARHNRYTLHASAVAWKGGAIVFAGRSGQGKSTLCTDLTRLGAGFMGDDIVFVYQDAGRAMIAPLLFDAKLHIDSQKEKTFVDMAAGSGGESNAALPLLAVAEITQTRQGFSSVAPAANEHRLFDVLLEAANNIALQYDSTEWLSLCANILEHKRLYNFSFGDRRLLDVNVLNEFFQ